MSNNLWSIDNFGVQNSREACHKRPQEFQVSIGDFRVEPVKGRREIENRDDKLAKKMSMQFFFHLSIVSFYSHCRKMKQFIKDCKSYDSWFFSIFHNFLQCLLDTEVSQIHVYF